jgi:hypothetical protein
MTIITLPRPTGDAVATQAVYLRTLWSDAWVAAPDLHCLRISASTCETIGAAEFHYRFGDVIHAGETAFTTKPVVSINPLSYVLVEIAGSGGRAGFTWCGVWRTARKGDVAQQFSAIGLETLLDNPCNNAPYWDGSSVRWAGRGLRFNARGLPNRSADRHTVHGQSVYVFDGTRAVGDYWSTRDAVETLLAMAAPLNAAGSVIFNWTPSNLAALPDFDQLNDEETHGASFLALLRALVPRQRLVGFGVRPGTGNTVVVSFDTFTAAAISLKDSAGVEVGTIPANSAQDALVITDDQSAVASLAIEGAAVIDQVIATGARRKSVFSLSAMDVSLAGLWTSAAETEYLDGATAAADYPPDDEPRLQDERNRAARAAEHLRDVFARYGPEIASWNQKVADGEGSGLVEDMLPIAVEDEDAATPVQFLLYPWEVQFSERLPLLTGYSYEADAIADRSTEAGHRAEELDAVHEPLPTLCFVRIVPADQDACGWDRWCLADQVGRGADLEQPDDQRTRRWSADARALRDTAAVELRVQGEAQHVLAATEMVAHANAITGAVRWEEDIILTVCAEDLRDVEVRYPDDADVVPYGELVRRLHIEAPQYQLVRVLPDTVVDVGVLLQDLVRTNGGILVDDRPQLRLLAQRTYEWHRQPRYALSLSTGWIDGAFGVGHLITQITDASGTWPVNSVVTEITLEFPVAQSAQSPRPTMTIATAFAELDPVSIGRI